MDKNKIPELFGSMVFNEAAMQQYVPSSAVQAWKECLDKGSPLTLEVANDIAEGMKNWALEHGATHYTHWFQPLTGITAEKHDAFINPIGGGKITMEFSGKELISSEPDASSFPNGGLRATFEARGYSAWDPTSFAFIKEDTLCIPTVFCSYSGEALDMKTPLLRSADAVNKQALRILRLFGDDTSKRVVAQIGPEQEYFLVDREMYMKREDLRLTGRTLFGAMPPKGQELDDHYFGSIRPRVKKFMADLDEELWKLGILSKTEHNEVAPSQHEMAPIYSPVNVAVDQNQLTMDVMKKVAERHGLVCLLHEKPFAGVNGSGKHDNFSLSTDSGRNLFSPGKTPRENAQFLLFLSAFIKGVDEYQELLRTSVAFAGNDHRLGAQEAPPAIVSVYLGEELDAVVDSIVNETDYTNREKKAMRIGVDVLPSIPKDTTDRNRTSPVAFTGNKFEFRMLGSSQSIAGPNIILQTIMADELMKFADELEGATDLNSAIHDVVKKALSDHRRIIFSGNGYDESWTVEAEKRGLVNLRNTAEALPKYIMPKNIELMTRQSVFSKTEMLARHDIYMEKYIKVINIEANTLVDMIQKSIIGAASNYADKLSRSITHKRAADPSVSCRMEMALLHSISNLSDDLLDKMEELKTALALVPDLELEKLIAYYHDEIFVKMGEARAIIDQLETLVNKEYWPFPSYTDLLFSV